MLKFGVSGDAGLRKKDYDIFRIIVLKGICGYDRF